MTHPPSSPAPWVAPALPAASARASAMDEVDVWSLLGVFWRRRYLIGACVALALVLCGAYLLVAKTEYRAVVQLRVQADRNPSLSDLAFNNIFGSLRVDGGAVRAEMEMVKSRSVAFSTMKRLDLLGDPEYNPAGLVMNVPALDAGMPPVSSGLSAMLPTGQLNFKTLNLFRQETNQLPPEVTDKNLGQVLDRFIASLDVKPVSGSTMMQVFVTASDPDKAARIANTLADAYLTLQIDGKLSSSQRITGWLAERLDTMRAAITRLETDIEQYRLANNLVEGASTEITNQRMSQVSKSANDIDIRLTEHETRLMQAREWVKDPKQSAVLSDILPSTTVTELQKRQAASLQRLSELEGRYGPKHPSIITARQEVAEVRAQIQSEARRQIIHLQATVENLKKQKEAFSGQIGDVRALRGQQSTASIRLGEMERELQSARAIYTSFAETYNKATQQQTLQSPQAQVISYASAPQAPAAPNRPLLLASSAIMGLMLGVILAFLQEHMAGTARSGDVLRARLSYPCLALVPAQDGAGQNADRILKEPQSPVAEAIRNLRASLRYRMGDSGNPPKVVAVTSSFSGEGKSTVAAWMAVQAARAGERVLLIDADLRRPSLGKLFTLDRKKSLDEYLTGAASLEETIVKHADSGLHVMFARAVPASAMDLVGSARMKALIESVGKVYDWVFIDTPATLLAAESRIIARQADCALYVARWHKTKLSAIETGTRALSDFGQGRIAFALTQVDLKSHARAGYGEIFDGDDAYAAQVIP